MKLRNVIYLLTIFYLKLSLCCIPYRFTASEKEIYTACCKEGDDVNAVRNILKTFTIKKALQLTTDYGEHLLHKAVLYDNVQIAALLIQHKAGVNTKTKREETPLHYAAEYSPRCVALLLEHKAIICAEGIGNRTPLHYAAKKPSATESIEILLKNKANIDACDYYNNAPIQENSPMGKTALHYAACEGCTQPAKKLIEYKARMDICDHQGHTPFYYACRKNHPDIAYIMRRNGADDSEISQIQISDIIREAIDKADTENTTILAQIILDPEKSFLLTLFPPALVTLVRDYLLQSD